MDKHKKIFNIYSIAFSHVLQAWGLKKGDIAHSDHRRYGSPSQNPPSDEQNALLIDEIGKAVDQKMSDKGKIHKSCIFNSALTKLGILHECLRIVANVVYYTEPLPNKIEGTNQGGIFGYMSWLLGYALNLQRYIADFGGLISSIKECINYKSPGEVNDYIMRLLEDLNSYISADRPFWELLRRLERTISGMQSPPRDSDINNGTDL